MNQRTTRILAVIVAGIGASAVVIVALYEFQPFRSTMGVDTHPFLCVNSPRLNSPTNISVVLSNCGLNGGDLQLTGYYVVDDNSSSWYANPNWSTAPTIPYNAKITENILIDGSKFTFQSGKNYTLTIATKQGSYSGILVSL